MLYVVSARMLWASFHCSADAYFSWETLSLIDQRKIFRKKTSIGQLEPSPMLVEVMLCATISIIQGKGNPAQACRDIQNTKPISEKVTGRFSESVCPSHYHYCALADGPSGGDLLEGRMLPDKPDDPEGAEVLHPEHVGEATHSILAPKVLPLIPITFLVIQNSVTMHTLLGYQSRVSTIRNQVMAKTINIIRSAEPWRSHSSSKTSKKNGQR